jgi:drug/metabolite transporter (DMT)-like permease
MLGVLAVSFGSIFVRLAGAPPLIAAVYRMFWASLFLFPWFARGPALELGALNKPGRIRLAAAGLALAGHFGFWISSLSYTSVAVSVLLVDTTPLFVGLYSQWILRRPNGRPFWAGLGLATAGCVAIVGDEWSRGSIAGTALALAGAVAMSAYLLLGGAVRRCLSIAAYAWPVYAVAAATLAAVCAAADTPLHGYSRETHLYLLLLGLVPQTVGHTSYNWALRWLRPSMVALLGLTEPLSAALLAYLLLNEVMSGSTVLGGILVLAGLYVASRRPS